MVKRLFLTGPTGVGKSTLLREILGARLAEAGGFVTAAQYGACGELTGFALSPAASAAGVTGFEPECFLDCTRFPPRTDNEVYRTTGVRLLEEAMWYPYALLDEIGGFELIIPQFRTALETLLGSDLPVIGALKTGEEAEALREALGLGEKTCAFSRALRQNLAADPEALVLPVSAPDDDEARAAIESWVRTWL